jgi:uncharacterized protein (TIGR02246 family)
MKAIWLTSVVLLVQWGLGAVLVAAEDAPADEAAIRASGSAFVAAYNARDAKRLAALWSPEAIYMDPSTGDETVGRAAIEEQFANAFADAGDAKLAVDVESIEFVSPNVAIERGSAHIVRLNEEPLDSHFTAVLVKRGGQWLLDRVSEVETPPAAPSSYEHLRDLEWMVGSWVDDDQDVGVRIHTDCEWTKNRNFMTRSFAVAIGDRVDLAGMQIVGWDPAAKQIRSWVFDSDGGFAEGLWTHKGNQWFIQAIGTLPDGGRSTAVNIITEVDHDSFKWQSVNREVDGELQPNIDEVLIVRKPTE